MKRYTLLNLMGFCLLLMSLNLTIGCGKKGDLIRPLPPEKQQTQPDNNITEEEKIDTNAEGKAISSEKY